MNQPAWPLWEVFIRSKQGLEHKHCGSLHATDSKQALQMARDVYTRRQEGVSIWVVPSNAITASAPDDKEALFDPAAGRYAKSILIRCGIAATLLQAPEKHPHFLYRYLIFVKSILVGLKNRQ